jgi:hypothetical protein
MRKRFLTFTFERESRWLVVLYLLVPLLAMLLSIVLPHCGGGGFRHSRSAIRDQRFEISDAR